MGLMKMLAFPVTGPMWIAQIIREEAEGQFYNIDGIRQQMLELEEQRNSGIISDDTYDHLEERLLHRLMEAREYHRQRQQPVQ